MKAHRLLALSCAFVTACGAQNAPDRTSDDDTSGEPTGAAPSGTNTPNSEASSSSARPSETSTSRTTNDVASDSGEANTSPETTTSTSGTGATKPASSSTDDDATDATDTSDAASSNENASETGASSQPGATTTDSEQPPLVGEPVEEELTPVPTARGEHGVGALRGEVYVLGGFTPTVTSSVQAYSPETDEWRDVADFPVVFHHPNVATVDDKLYVLGFHAGSGQRQGDPSSYAYDPEVNEWTAVTPMPPETARGASCVTTYQGRVYIFGGTNGDALPDASAYDPETDEWEVLPFVPAMRHHCVAAVFNDKIYIVSGRDVVITEVQAESYVFDPVGKTYEEVAEILTPRGGSAGGLLFGRIFVFGGEGNTSDPNGIFHEAEFYDPATDTWHVLPDMKVPRHGFGGAVIGDRMYLPAGSVSQGIDVTDAFSVFYYQ